MTKLSVKSRVAMITDEEILTYFLDYYTKNKSWPQYKHLEEYPLAPPGATVRRRFTSLKLAKHAAMMRAGLLSKHTMIRVTYARQIVMEKIKQHPRYGDPLWRITRSQALRDPDFPKMINIIFAYGTLDNFLRAADLLPTQPSSTDLIVAIRLAAATLGHTPTVNDCDNGFCGYDRKTYLRQYPSWNTLLSAAGLEINEKHADKQKAETRRKIAAFYQNHPDSYSSRCV